MSNRRKTLLGLALAAAVLLRCIPFAVETPQPLFEQSVSALPTRAFPLLATLGVLVFSLAALAKPDVRGAEKSDQTPKPLSLPAIATPLVLIMFAAVAWGYLGYVATCALVALAMSFWLGNRSYPSLAAISLGLPAAMYWLVTRVFSTYLPAGWLSYDFLS